MKTLNDIKDRLNFELNHHRIRSIKEPGYMYYLESTNCHDGGFLICTKRPKNLEYKLVTGERVSKTQPFADVFNEFLNYLVKLPILSIKGDK